jgi:hypothetical protein
VEYGLPEDEIGIIWRDHPTTIPHRLIQIASADTLIRREFPKTSICLLSMRRTCETRVTESYRITGEKGGYRFIWYTVFPVAGPLLQHLIKPTTIGELIQRGTSVSMSSMPQQSPI